MKFDFSKIVMAVVIGTIAFLILNTIGVWICAALRVPTPEGMDTMIGTALGYLGGILTSIRSHTEPQSVEVVNPKSDPVPVEATDE